MSNHASTLAKRARKALYLAAGASTVVGAVAPGMAFAAPAPSTTTINACQSVNYGVLYISGVSGCLKGDTPVS